jgi:hypothetical protein
MKSIPLNSTQRNEQNYGAGQAYPQLRSPKPADYPSPIQPTSNHPNTKRGCQTPQRFWRLGGGGGISLLDPLSIPNIAFTLRSPISGVAPPDIPNTGVIDTFCFSTYIRPQRPHHSSPATWNGQENVGMAGRPARNPSLRNPKP